MMKAQCVVLAIMLHVGVDAAPTLRAPCNQSGNTSNASGCRGNSGQRAAEANPSLGRASESDFAHMLSLIKEMNKTINQLATQMATRADIDNLKREQDQSMSVTAVTSILSARLQGWYPSTERMEDLQAVHETGVFPTLKDRNDKKPMDLQEGWSNMYKSEGHKFWSLYRPKKELERMVKSWQTLSYGDSLAALVLGCGVGTDVAFLAEQLGMGKNQSGAVAGIDFAQGAIELARQKYGATPGVRFYQADACELPVPSVPLDLIVDNTVLQNLFISPRGIDCYLEMLGRISTPDHTLLHLNIMSFDGVAKRKEFDACNMGIYKLPLMKIQTVWSLLANDWDLIELKEGVYDLRPEASGFKCQAFYDWGGHDTPGIPSWSILAVRKQPKQIPDVASLHENEM